MGSEIKNRGSQICLATFDFCPTAPQTIPNTNQRLAALEIITRNQDRVIRKQAGTIAKLRGEVAEMKTMVDWDDDPNVRRFKGSTLAVTAGSLAWLGGAFGSIEAIKFASWSALPFIHDNPLALTIQQFGALAAGFGIIGRQSEQIVKGYVVSAYKMLLKT